MSSRYLDPTNDIAFKKLFSNKERLISLLNSILKLDTNNKIIDLDYIPVEQMPLFKDGKKSIFDLKVRDAADRWYIIEMQRKTETSYIDRVQLYGCYSYVNQIEAGIKHEHLLPVVIISILGQKIFPDEIPCINYHQLKETTTNKQYLYSLMYVFVELGKFDKNKIIETEVDQWLHLLKYAHSESAPPTTIENENILSAYNDLEQYNWTALEHDAYIRSQLVTEADESKIENAKEEGDIAIALNLLKIKTLSDSDISTATGLSIEKIKSLRNKGHKQ